MFFFFCKPVQAPELRVFTIADDSGGRSFNAVSDKFCHLLSAGVCVDVFMIDFQPINSPVVDKLT